MPERLLLCTDLDRTLIPNGPQPESPGARDRFAALAGSPHVVLAYVTGRHRAGQYLDIVATVAAKHGVAVAETLQ